MSASGSDPLAGKRVWVAGHRGMLGSALVRRLEKEGAASILGASRAELDLRDPAATLAWVRANRPDIVFLPAGTIGGIMANKTCPADFLRDNILIAASVIDAAFRAGVEKLLYVASAAVYPLSAAQPLREEALMGGPLEPAHEGYSMAKLAGIKLCQTYRRQHGADFISVLPTNLYGPGDNYDPERSHVVPALIRKADDARRRGERGMEIWGSGRARRDFLHVDDCADALVHLMHHHSGEAPVNVGSGGDITILELAKTVMDVVGLDGPLTRDESKPDGAPRRMLDITVLKRLGWTPKISLHDGISDAYADYCRRFGHSPA